MKYCEVHGTKPFNGTAITDFSWVQRTCLCDCLQSEVNCST